jgi:hypothetical protein
LGLASDTLRHLDVLRRATNQQKSRHTSAETGFVMCPHGRPEVVDVEGVEHTNGVRGFHALADF